MNLVYEVYVRHEVYLSLGDLDGTKREPILRFIEALAVNPFRGGDQTLLSPTGREYQVQYFGRFALCFWVDHAAKEVRVVEWRSMN